MKMILIDSSKNPNHSYHDLTQGKAYDHVGNGFLDDVGHRRLVHNFSWEQEILSGSAGLKDDDREEPRLDLKISPDNTATFTMKEPKFTLANDGQLTPTLANDGQLTPKSGAFSTPTISPEVAQMIIARDILDALIIKASL